MKKYKLRRWYPSLDKMLEVGDIGDRYLFEFGNGTKEDRFSILKGGRLIYIPIQELHPYFWELIVEENPKPLFITDDGVEVFDRDGIVWLVRNNNFDKIKIHSIHLNDYDFEHKVFFHEANADEYIWCNKPLFSYNEIWKYTPYGSDLSIFYQLAKERAKE